MISRGAAARRSASRVASYSCVSRRGSAENLMGPVTVSTRRPSPQACPQLQWRSDLRRPERSPRLQNDPVGRLRPTCLCSGPRSNAFQRTGDVEHGLRHERVPADHDDLVGCIRSAVDRVRLRLPKVYVNHSLGATPRSGRPFQVPRRLGPFASSSEIGGEVMRTLSRRKFSDPTGRRHQDAADLAHDAQAARARAEQALIDAEVACSQFRCTAISSVGRGGRSADHGERRTARSYGRALLVPTSDRRRDEAMSEARQL
jgi:hypothetical protein